MLLWIRVVSTASPVMTQPQSGGLLPHVQTFPATYPPPMPPVPIGAGRPRLTLVWTGLTGAVLAVLAGTVPAWGVPPEQDSRAPPPPVIENARIPEISASKVRPDQAASLTTVPDRADSLESGEQGRTSILFPQGSEALTAEAAQALDRMAARMLANRSERLELRAHAAPTGHGEGGPRRLSLARALAVRGYLLDRGVEKHRLIVYALGSQGSDGTDAAAEGRRTDRVDLAVKP